MKVILSLLEGMYGGYRSLCSGVMVPSFVSVLAPALVADMRRSAGRNRRVNILLCLFCLLKKNGER